MRTLSKSNLLDIAHGACFLGAGGGGTLQSGLDMINAHPEIDCDSWGVDVVTVEEAAAYDKLSCVSLFGGSPKSSRDLTIDPAVHAMQEMNKICEGRIGNSVPLEIGALNSIAAILVAHQCGFAVVDGDGAGRAIPELTHTTFSVAPGLSMNPTVMGTRDDGQNAQGHTVVLNLGNYERMHDVFAAIISSGPFRRLAGAAMWAMEPDSVAKAIPIRNTLLLCEDIGRTLRSTCGSTGISEVIELLRAAGRDARVLFKGELAAIGEGGADMYDVGHAVFKSNTETVQISVQNESLIAWSDRQARALCMLPDSICAVTEDGLPFSMGVNAKEIRGKAITLVGVPAEPVLVTNCAIMAAYKKTLARNGYGGSYVPLPPLSS